MALRWLPTVLQSFVDPNGSDAELIFTDGQANIIAKYMLDATLDCVQEGQAIRENDNLYVSLADTPSDYYPILRNELVTFDYPLAYEDFKSIFDSPYGRIKFQCADGSYEEGYIKQLDYSPVEGIAKFTLIPVFVMPS